MFTPDVKQTPYWWEGAAPPEPGAPVLPAAVDVLVVGAGYTGLNAALQTARGGYQTLVLDAEAAGWGCSSRNGGQISTSVKPTYTALAKRHGERTARAILEEGAASLRWIGELIQEEGIDCAFRVVGRFHGAHSPARFDRLARAAVTKIPGLEEDAYPVPRSEQQRELGTDAYFGGVVFPRHASVDPARYHRGLLERVTEAGATAVSRCRVTGLERQGDGFSAQTPSGSVQARRVIIATNGYTGALTPGTVVV